jgi:hypothetical protein
MLAWFCLVGCSLVSHDTAILTDPAYSIITQYDKAFFADLWVVELSLACAG